MTLVSKTIQDLAARTAKEVSSGANRIGEVTTASPLEVQFYGSTTPRPVTLKIDGYTPVVGDKVLLAWADSRYICIGKVVTA